MYFKIIAITYKIRFYFIPRLAGSRDITSICYQIYFIYATAHETESYQDTT